MFSRSLGFLRLILKIDAFLQYCGVDFKYSSHIKYKERYSEKWKWKSLSRVRLWDLVDCTVQEILQARLQKWAAFPFSRGSSQLRDLTQVSRIAGRFFTNWATGEASTES